uniref:Uncharacterized protein n=1 Tax=Utricularia reniformis TaxID=192314 RepID=A0A1Y0AYQ4_9LAMI|nr:hypothetical protein AEK19_MT0401 [Utricularia reniformis]ART30278.1 hypothetical protein AEK19_MT0401 [Utricularia reniformis]
MEEDPRPSLLPHPKEPINRPNGALYCLCFVSHLQQLQPKQHTEQTQKTTLNELDNFEMETALFPPPIHSTPHMKEDIQEYRLRGPDYPTYTI